MTEQFGPEKYQLLQELGRTELQTIWQSENLGLPLKDEKARMAKIMRQHREYLDLWSHLGEFDDNDIVRDGVDPVMHINTHLIVENQIAINDPPEVAVIVKELTKNGYTRDEAIHAVAKVILSEIFDMLKKQSVFDRESYLRELRKFPAKKAAR